MSPRGLCRINGCPCFQHYLQDKDSAHVGLLELIEKMLEYVPEQRILLAEMLRHTFFTPCKRQMRAMALMNSLDDVATAATTAINSANNNTPAMHEQPLIDAHNFNRTRMSSCDSFLHVQPGPYSSVDLGAGMTVDGHIAAVCGVLDVVDGVKQQVVGQSNLSVLAENNSNFQKRWAGLPSANYSLDDGDMFVTSTFEPLSETTHHMPGDSGILRRLERQVAIDGNTNGNHGTTVQAKHSSVNSHAAVCCLWQPAQGVAGMGTIEPGDTIAREQTDSSVKETDIENVIASSMPESLPVSLLNLSLKCLNDGDPVFSTEHVALPITVLPVVKTATLINVTPASPVSNDPPEFMEVLGMGRFYNQSVQTPERFYREMCPSPHEMSFAATTNSDKATQTPAQFYPSILTHDVAIDAGQFLDHLSVGVARAEFCDDSAADSQVSDAERSIQARQMLDADDDIKRSPDHAANDIKRSPDYADCKRSPDHVGKDIKRSPDYDDSKRSLDHADSKRSPDYDDRKRSPDHAESKRSPDYDDSKRSPDYADSKRSPDYADSKRSPDYDDSKRSPDYDDSKRSPDYDDSKKSPDYDDSKRSPDHDDSKRSPDHDDSKRSPDHDDSKRSPDYDDSKISPDYDDSKRIPDHVAKDIEAGLLSSDSENTNNSLCYPCSPVCTQPLFKGHQSGLSMSASSAISSHEACFTQNAMLPDLVAVIPYNCSDACSSSQPAVGILPSPTTRWKPVTVDAVSPSQQTPIAGSQESVVMEQKARAKLRREQRRRRQADVGGDKAVAVTSAERPLCHGSVDRFFPCRALF